MGGTLIGILIVTVLNNLMNLLGIPPYSQKIAKGAIIALAVLVERRRELHRQPTVVAKFERLEPAQGINACEDVDLLVQRTRAVERR